MKKFYIILFVIVIALGAGAYYYFNSSSNEKIKYRTEKVSRGSVVVQVRATGTINPVQTVQVGSQVSGTISRITVDFNSVVVKGEILAQIDSTFLYASVKEAEANVERNQAQVNEAKRIVDRTNDLFKKNFASQSELDAAQTTYESAIAQVKQAQAALDRARVNIRYSTIKSPIDGVVISRDIDVGQTVAASLQAPKLFSIANDLTHMQVEANVDEADIGQIKEGQSVTFSVDSYAEETFMGTVKQVRLAPVITQNVVTYTVIIDVPNPDLKLRPGMTATVSILIEQREDVLRIPTLALRFQPPADVLDERKGVIPESGMRQNQAQAQSQKRDTTRAMKRTGENQKMRSGMEGQSDNGKWRSAMKRGNEKKSKFSMIWLTDPKTGIKSMTVKLGLNDARFVEILEGEINEGDEVVIGMQSAETTLNTGQQTNPFAPRMGGGGGGRGVR